MVKDPGLSMNAKQFDENIPTLKKMREAGNHLFDQFSEGCLYKDKIDCTHEKRFERTWAWSGHMLCKIHNCPKLD